MESASQEKARKIESPCLSELIKMGVYIIIGAGTILWGLAIFFAEIKDLPKRVSSVENEVNILKADISYLKSDVKNIDRNTQKILDVMLKEKK